MPERLTYSIQGIDCAVCAARIQDAINTIEGVGSTQIDLMANRLEITSDRTIDAQLDQQVRQTVLREEPHASVALLAGGNTGGERKAIKFDIVVPLRILTALLLVWAARSWTGTPWAFLLYLLSYAASGYDVVYRAMRNIVRGNLFDEHFLMTVATMGAFAIGEYAEAVAVMAFYQAGEYMQDLAVDRSKASIARLMDIRPESATVVRDGVRLTLAPEEIMVGDVLLIKAGEKIPVDAVVISGNSTLDTKALTGESVPRAVSPGDALISGCINGSGVLHAEASVAYQDSTVATILRLVEESGMRKAKTERFITRFARYYTPIVVLLAAAIAIVPPLFGPDTFSVWFYRALVFLVISCPCALVISVPLGFFGGIGGMARMGVLAKGGNFIQAMAKARTIVFDKTGTLTKGSFTVSLIEPVAAGVSEDELLRLAAAIESHSTHPVAKAIVARYGKRVSEATDIEETPGMGVAGTVGHRHIRIGTERYVQPDVQAGKTSQESAGTTVQVSADGILLGSITVTDTVKPEGKEMVESLRTLGADKLVILSGDGARTVEGTAKDLGIETFHSRLLPQDKLAHVERLIGEQRDGGTVLFVGDGVNDAPVLARADVGLAMGGIGSDAAVEAADVVIMTDDLSKIPAAIRHSRRTMAIVRQNIVFALGVKVFVMALGALGFASMWLAVFADTGVALLAVMNSLRALRHK